ncbi:hypothetical protein GGI24_001148 [Coemansia furcata]|nr:hypothetical protein GGI24_001148 [Coemansia furcata]
MADPSAPPTNPGSSVSAQPRNFVPFNQDATTSTAIVAYSLPPTLTDISSSSPTMPSVVEQQPHHSPRQFVQPIAAEINAGQQVMNLLQHQSPHLQSVFQDPRAQEAMGALQTLEDSVDHVHAEGKK